MNLEYLCAYKRMIFQLFEGELKKNHPFKYVWSIFQNYEIIPNYLEKQVLMYVRLSSRKGIHCVQVILVLLHVVSKPLDHLGNLT